MERPRSGSEIILRQGAAFLCGHAALGAETCVHTAEPKGVPLYVGALAYAKDRGLPEPEWAVEAAAKAAADAG